MGPLPFGGRRLTSIMSYSEELVQLSHCERLSDHWVHFWPREELVSACLVGELLLVLYSHVASHPLHTAQPATLRHPPTHWAGERSLITTPSSGWIDLRISCQMGKNSHVPWGRRKSRAIRP